MNYLWGFMIIAGIVYGAFHGTLPEVTQAAIDSSKEAVTLCITMTGVMSLWMGLMRIAEQTGIIKSAVNFLKPFLKFLFPNIPKNHPANQYIAENCIANIFGLGWAATPAGLKAMERLAELEEERRGGRVQVPEAAAKKRTKKSWVAGGMPRGVASNEMCTFMILNISSLQLIPVNLIAYRAQYGSVNPTAIVGPGIVATAVSTGVSIIFCKVMDRKRMV